VVFYYNDTNNETDPVHISTDTSAPYTGVLDTTALANGTWYLYTVAIDEAGNTTTSTIIPVTVDNTKPVVHPLTFPEHASTAADLVGLATHGTLNITQVEYFIDTT
jgi:hypothetical protein